MTPNWQRVPSIPGKHPRLEKKQPKTAGRRGEDEKCQPEEVLTAYQYPNFNVAAEPVIDALIQGNGQAQFHVRDYAADLLMGEEFAMMLAVDFFAPTARLGYFCPRQTMRSVFWT